jgi:N-methylhydantoinase A
MTLRFAVDTGGTFTDLVVEGSGPLLRFYKRATTPANPVEGLLDVLGAAADEHALTLRELLGRGDLLIFGTTRATNAVVTGTTAKTALLCTQGHPDVLLFREGGGRTSLFDYTQEYPTPYVPRSLTFEVPERILSDGSVARSIDEDEVRAIGAELLLRQVEAVAVCLLWSTMNPAHELRVASSCPRSRPSSPSRSRTCSIRASASTGARRRQRSTRRSSL